MASRGMNGAGTRGSSPVGFNAVADVRATYDNGIISTSLDKNGNIVTSGGLFGVEATIGLFGTKSWKRRRLGIDYTGNYRHYNSNTSFNGSDHYLGMNFAQQLGLDMTAFNKCFQANTYADQINQDYQAGSAKGVPPTPAIFVNGNVVVSSQGQNYIASVADLSAVIDAALAGK